MLMIYNHRFWSWCNKSAAYICLLKVSHQFAVELTLQNITSVFSRRGSEEKTNCIDPPAEEEKPAALEELEICQNKVQVQIQGSPSTTFAVD